jgi:hypothetical protein
VTTDKKNMSNIKQSDFYCVDSHESTFQIVSSDSQRTDLCVFRMYHFVFGIEYLSTFVNFSSIFIIYNGWYYCQK